MKLFSWFIKKDPKSSVTAEEKMLTTTEEDSETKYQPRPKSAMWPTAKVRKAPLIQQHQFINTTKAKSIKKTVLNLYSNDV